MKAPPESIMPMNKRRSDDEPGEEPVQLSGDESSAGRNLGAMRYVLVISLAAVVAVFAALLMIYR